MNILYNTALELYELGARIAGARNRKAKLMTEGQRRTPGIMKEQIDPKASYIWIHVSSLGEFEQGRPLIEHIRAQYPQYKILLTFFSPDIAI